MTVVTNVSDLIRKVVANLHWHIQNVDNNLANNYDTKDEIEYIRENQQFSVVRVEELPEEGTNQVLYLMQVSGDDDNLGVYNEYVWFPATSSYECIGSTEFDMRNYHKVDEVNKLLDGEAYSVNIGDYTFSNTLNDVPYVGFYTVDTLPVITATLIAGSYEFGDPTVPLTETSSWVFQARAVIPATDDTAESYITYGDEDGVKISVSGSTLTVSITYATGGLSHDDEGYLPIRNSIGENEDNTGFSVSTEIEENKAYYVRVVYNASVATYKVYVGSSLDSLSLVHTCRVHDSYKLANPHYVAGAGNYIWNVVACSNPVNVTWDLSSLTFIVPSIGSVYYSTAREGAVYYSTAREGAVYRVPTSETVSADSSGYDYYVYRDKSYELIAPTDYIKYAELSNYYTKEESYSQEEFNAGLVAWYEEYINNLSNFEADTTFIQDYWDEVLGGYNVEQITVEAMG